MLDEKKHGDVIARYEELNSKLKIHGLFVHAWGRIAICKISDPYTGWLANNLDTIEEAEQWYDGFLYGISLKCS